MLNPLEGKLRANYDKILQGREEKVAFEVLDHEACATQQHVLQLLPLQKGKWLEILLRIELTKPASCTKSGQFFGLMLKTLRV